MERIYAFLKKNQSTAFNICVTYIIATITNILGGSAISSSKEFLHKMVDTNNFSVFLMYIAFAIIVIYLVVECILQKMAYNTDADNIFKGTMNSHTDKCFDINKGGLSWGMDKTCILCENILEGWKPEDVKIEDIDFTHYSFNEKNEENELLRQEKYEEFLNGEFQPVAKQGNNNCRWMLTNAKTNFNKKKKQLFISLKMTEWSQTSYIWKKIMIDELYKTKKIADFYTKTGELLPNSFCLHMIIETKDGKILLAKISKQKHDDYPNTLAATIGEQIEKEDFMDGTDYEENFVLSWVKRALKEEFAFSNQDFDTKVDRDSIRVLSIDVEGDIYNFALLCVLKVNYDFEQIKNHGSAHPMQASEICELQTIEINNIPEILVNDDRNNKNYHPSTYLRLLIFYIYKNGYKRTSKQIKLAKKKILKEENNKK